MFVILPFDLANSSNVKDSYNVSSNPNEIQYKLNFKENEDK